MIPRLADGRTAILGKLHHAMVDGVAGVELGVMVPVNVRKPGEDTHGAGNRITFGFVELPVGSDRAEERVRRVVEAMMALKQDGRLAGSSRRCRATAIA